MIGVVPTETLGDTTMTTETATTRETLEEIRTLLGHNGVECRVRINRAGRITRHGAPDPTDRSMDYWQDMGHVEDWR